MSALSDHERVKLALARADKSKTAIGEETGLGFAQVGHILATLEAEGVVIKAGLRYRLTYVLPVRHADTHGVWGRSPRF